MSENGNGKPTLDQLLGEGRRELIREIVGEVLTERQAEAQHRELAEQEALKSIRRRYLSPREKSDLIDKLGKDGYLSLEWDDERPAPPRDPATGRFCGGLDR